MYNNYVLRKRSIQIYSIKNVFEYNREEKQLPITRLRAELSLRNSIIYYVVYMQLDFYADQLSAVLFAFSETKSAYTWSDATIAAVFHAAMSYSNLKNCYLHT